MKTAEENSGDKLRRGKAGKQVKISILIPSGILLAVYWGYWFLKDRKRGVPLSVALAFTCLFIPKVNLIHVNRMYSTAGIRTDDILALVLLIVSLRDSFTYKNRHIRWGICFLAVLTVSNLVSMFIGRANGFDNAVMFSILSIVRKYEYFAFALIGIYLTRKTRNAQRTALEQLTWMNVFHIIIGLLQVAKLCNVANGGVITGKEYHGFAISTFNGNYEYGQFLCLSVVIYLFFFLRAGKAYLEDRSAKKALFCWGGPVWRMLLCTGMILASLVMTALTKSRSSLVIEILLIVLILVFMVRKSGSRVLKVIVAAGIVVCLAVGALFATGTLKIGRFSVVNLSEYAEELQKNIQDADLREYVEIVRDDEIIEKKTVKTEIQDRSAAIRFNKWGAALAGFREHPVFGYGTGVTHVIDGNYIKLLAETGIVGTLLWLAMFVYFMHVMRKAGKRILPGRCAFWMMVSVLMASVFLDMFEASKPMETLWLVVGLVIALDAGRREEMREVPQDPPEAETDGK